MKIKAFSKSWIRSINHALKLMLLPIFVAGLLLVFFGTFAGDPVYYALGSYTIIAITITSFLIVRSSKTLLLLVIVIHLSLRYIPILKYNQPLLLDPCYELTTATEFEKNGRIDILLGRSRFQARSLWYQSGWPAIHLLAITIHQITGLSLFNVFTYFSPLVDLSTLLFVYLFASYVFRNQRIGVLSALIYATFFINMYWTGIQLIRQTIAYPLMLMSLYLYAKYRTEKKRKLTALVLLTFVVLPIAHHLTPIEMFYSFLLLSLLELSYSLGRRLHALIFHTVTIKKSVSDSFPLFLCLFVGVATFLWWGTYSREIIIPILAQRARDAILNIVNASPKGGQFQETVFRTGEVFYVGHPGIYDILSYFRVLFIAVATLYGVFVLAREKTEHRFILYALIFGPLSLFAIGYLLLAGFEAPRHLLFLIIPSFVTTAWVTQKINRKIIALCLLIILLPAPFELFDLPSRGDPTPTFIYDKYGLGNIVSGRDTFYREDIVLAAASFFSSHSRSNLTADGYVASALMFYYDPYMVASLDKLLVLLSSPHLIHSQHSTILIDKPSFDNKILRPESRIVFEKTAVAVYERLNVTLSFEDFKDYSNRLDSITNRFYDNGDVAGWKSPP